MTLLTLATDGNGVAGAVVGQVAGKQIETGLSNGIGHAADLGAHRPRRRRSRKSPPAAQAALPLSNTTASQSH